MMKVRNKQLYRGYLETCISAFKLLKREQEKAPRRTIEEKVVFHRNGTYSKDIVERPALGRIINRQTKKIEALSEYKSFSSVLDSDNRIAYLRTVDENQAQHYSFSALFNFLARLARRTASFDFDQKAFNSLYKDYEDYVYSDSFYHHGFCILQQFNCDTKRFSLAGGLEIKRITNKERKIIYGMETLRLHQFFNAQWILQKKEVIKRDKHPSWDSLSCSFDDLVTALRLIKNGQVGYIHIYSYLVSAWDTSIRGSLVGRDFYGQPYSVTKLELSTIRTLWRRYLHLKSVGGLKNREEIEIALSRFNIAYERKSEEDRLIDYVVAFESLLLENPQEVTYKFSLRGALLVGLDIREAKERWTYQKRANEYLATAYKLRSSIVHGSQRLPSLVKMRHENIPIGEFIETISGYLRKSIGIYFRLASYGNKKTILPELDNLALGHSSNLEKYL